MVAITPSFILLALLSVAQAIAVPAQARLPMPMSWNRQSFRDGGLSILARAAPADVKAKVTAKKPTAKKPTVLPLPASVKQHAMKAPAKANAQAASASGKKHVKHQPGDHHRNHKKHSRRHHRTNRIVYEFPEEPLFEAHGIPEERVIFDGPPLMPEVKVIEEIRERYTESPLLPRDHFVDSDDPLAIVTVGGDEQSFDPLVDVKLNIGQLDAREEHRHRHSHKHNHRSHVRPESIKTTQGADDSKMEIELEGRDHHHHHHHHHSNDKRTVAAELEERDHDHHHHHHHHHNGRDVGVKAEENNPEHRQKVEKESVVIEERDHEHHHHHHHHNGRDVGGVKHPRDADKDAAVVEGRDHEHHHHHHHHNGRDVDAKVDEHSSKPQRTADKDALVVEARDHEHHHHNHHHHHGRATLERKDDHHHHHHHHHGHRRALINVDVGQQSTPAPQRVVIATAANNQPAKTMYLPNVRIGRLPAAMLPAAPPPAVNVASTGSPTGSMATLDNAAPQPVDLVFVPASNGTTGDGTQTGANAKSTTSATTIPLPTTDSVGVKGVTPPTQTTGATAVPLPTTSPSSTQTVRNAAASQEPSETPLAPYHFMFRKEDS